MNFDSKSAVTETEGAINTTSFDINSAKNEPQLQAASEPSTPTKYNQTGDVTNEAQAPSPISGFVRGIIKFMGGGLEQFNQDNYTYEHAKDFPSQIKGEGSDSYNNRIQEFYKPREDQIIAGGVMKQLDVPMQMALVAALPVMSLTHLAQLGAFIGLDQVRSSVQKITLPDASPTLKDVLDLGGFAGEAKIVGSVSDGLKDFISNSMLSQGKSPTVDLTPENIRTITENDVLTKEEKQKTLDNLGITEDHINASISSNMPIRVPISSFIDLSQEPYWDRVQNELKSQETSTEEIKPPEGSLNKEQALTYLNIDNNGQPKESGRITISSSEGKKDINNTIGQESSQTGLENIKKTTLDEINSLADKHDLKITITGGTEKGVHDNSLEFSHEKGDKVDLRFEPKLDKTITSWKDTEERQNKNGETEIGYKNPDSNAIYWKEGNHWDVEVRPQVEGKTKTSGLSKSIEDKAIKDGLVKDLGELPSYKQRNMDDIAGKVSEFITNNYELAKKIALGEAPEQDGLRQPEIFTGIRVKAEAEGGIETLRELALSDKASALATEAGQRVKALDSGSPDSTIEAIREIKKSREGSSKTKTEKTKIVKDIQKEIKKSKPKKEDWNSFIDSLEC